MIKMKKTALILTALALMAAACGPTENAANTSRTKNSALAVNASTTNGKPSAPPQIFLKIDTLDLTPTSLQGTPKFVAKLRWSSPLNDGGSPVTGYEIQFRWNSFESQKPLVASYKNWTSCSAENVKVPNSFPACSAATTSTATSAEISSDYWQSYCTPGARCSTRELSHMVQGLEYRVAAINANGTSEFSPPTQQTCKYGGACEFGDLGPGGGVVYDVPSATSSSSGWTSNGASEVAGADWEYSGNHSWAAMAWAAETDCPGWSCYAPIPPTPCWMTKTTPVRYSSSRDTCLTRDAWHLPFAMPLTNVAEWRGLCNKFDDLARTWGRLRGGSGFFYWSASNVVIPAGISVDLNVTTIANIIANPGPGVLVEMAQSSYDKWSTSALERAQAIRFPCDSSTKTVKGSYDRNGRLFASDGTIYHDNSVRTGISKPNLSRPIRTFTTNRPAIAPQVAPVITAQPGDGGVVLKWSAGTPDTNLLRRLQTAQILPLTGYALEYKKSTDSQWTRVPAADSVNMSRVIGNGTLTSEVQYDFRVAEVNSLGTGPFSGVASAKPGKFAQRTLSVSTTSGVFPNVDLSTSGGDGSGAITYTASNGTATGCRVQGRRLSVDRVGTCTIVATKAGDDRFIGAVSAPQVVGVTPGPQAPLSITSLTSPFDEALPLVTQGGSGDGAVSFTVNESDRSICAIANNALTFKPVYPQTGFCRVSATKAASVNYLATSTETTTIQFTRGSQAPLVIETPASVKVPEQKIVVKASGGSGTGEATFRVRNGTATSCDIWPTSQRNGVISSEVSVNAFGTAPVSAGTCIVTVTRAGDATYREATSSEVTVTFLKSNQATVTLPVPASRPFTGARLNASGGSGSGAFSYALVDREPSTSALTKAPNCRIDGSTLRADARGVCWVTAKREGDDAYEASAPSESVEVILNVAPQPTLNVQLSPSTGFAGVENKVTTTVTGGAGKGALKIEARDATAKGCRLAGSIITARTSGTCRIIVQKDGDFNYETTRVEASFKMNIGQQAPLSIKSGLRGQALSLDVPVLLSTSGGSGTGVVTYEVTDAGTAECTVEGGKLSARAAGSCSVTATKAADSSFAEVRSTPMVIPFDVQLGDTGPAGGSIVYIAKTPQPWGQYLEAAPSNWAGGSDLVVDWATAVQRVSQYRGGGLADWRLPTAQELLDAAPRLPGAAWTIEMEPSGRRETRPVRTFG